MPIEPSTDHRVIVLIETEIREQSLNSDDIVYEIEKISDLTIGFIQSLAPDFAICPLFTLRSDAIDVGRMMVRARVDTKLLIKAPPLPRPGMVLREIRHACPGLKIAYFDLSLWAQGNRLSA